MSQGCICPAGPDKKLHYEQNGAPQGWTCRRCGGFDSYDFKFEEIKMSIQDEEYLRGLTNLGEYVEELKQKNYGQNTSFFFTRIYD